MKPIALTLALVFALFGCDNSEPTTAAPAVPVAAPAPAVDMTPATPVELEYTTRIEPNGPDKSTIIWTARVPTGGWSMTTDSVLIEDDMGKMWARVWVTIESPDPNATVTQAFETLTGMHEADKPVEKTEFSVRRMIKGEIPPFAPLYAIVKSDPRW
jgi:hypothetical protein